MPQPTILTYAGWEEDARFILGVTVYDISDAQLRSIAVLGQAEAYVKDKISNWEELEGQDLNYLRLAVLYMMAFYVRENLVFTMPTSIKDGENAIAWGRNVNMKKEEANPFYIKAWECIYTILGTYTDVSPMGISLPSYDVITGE